MNDGGDEKSIVEKKRTFSPEIAQLQIFSRSKMDVRRSPNGRREAQLDQI